MQPNLLAADADEYSVTRSLEPNLLWLFGYIMFNNTHGNSVDRILLPYTQLSSFPCPATAHHPTSQYYTTTGNVDISLKLDQVLLHIY